MTGRLHRRWRRQLLREAGRWLPERGLRLLDLGAGSGVFTAAAFAVLGRARFREAVLVDLAPRMLEVARKRLGGGVRYLSADISEPPVREVDLILAGFVLRNMEAPEASLRRWLQALRRGGVLLLLDVFRPRGFWAPLLRAYLRGVVLPLGARLAKQPTAYEHLVSSVLSFDGRQWIPRVAREEGARVVRVWEWFSCVYGAVIRSEEDAR